MRVISSLTFVGTLLPPMNWLPLFGAGKIPALSRSCAFGSSNDAGIVLFGNGCPKTNPSDVYLACSAGESWLAFGTLIVVGNTPPYVLVRGTVCFSVCPWIRLRHSML